MVVRGSWYWLSNTRSWSSRVIPEAGTEHAERVTLEAGTEGVTYEADTGRIILELEEGNCRSWYW